jgi:ammonia channel protein AmtB
MIVRNAHTSAAVIIITTATGLVACLVGLYAQMISATREQRILIVTGIIAGFVGLAIALGQGGFTA